MANIEGQKALVTGGSSGLGLGIVEALVEQKALVTVVARNAERLAKVAAQLGVKVIQGDVTDEKLARRMILEIQPSILVLNAGAAPVMRPLNQLTWEEFNLVWDVDVKAGFHWVQEALRLPLASGSRVIIASSGAALNGSPLSGSYAGAKKMLWFMTQYANGISQRRRLGIRFQTILPQQIIGDTELGRKAAEAYAIGQGVSLEDFLAGFGAPMPPRKVGDHVVSILTDLRYLDGVAFGMKGDLGVTSLDA